MKATTTTAPFALDPTLPWLFSDRKMQEPAAFRNMETVTLNDEPWEPMAQYFPGGAQLAMRRVTSLNELTVGAAYWYKHSYFEPSRDKVLTRYYMGRYVGLAFPESKSTPRRWKKGEAHITLECDVLDCDLGSYHFREDGTYTAFVDVTGQSHQLYQITHYVSLPASLLGELGPEAVKQSGLTLRQACYLKQEQEIRRDTAVELTAKTTWPDLSDLRVVLPFDEIRDFLTVQDSLTQLTASQARKCKLGSLTVTFRSVNKVNGCDFQVVEHFDMAEGCKLIDWLRHHSSVQETTLNAAIVRQSIGLHAEAIRAQTKADAAAKEAAQAAAKASVIEHPIMGQEDDYASVRELAFAA